LLCHGFALAVEPNFAKGTKPLALLNLLDDEDLSAGMNGKYFFEPDLALIGELTFSRMDNDSIHETSVTENTRQATLLGSVRK
jgi:hypothetical protein